MTTLYCLLFDLSYTLQWDTWNKNRYKLHTLNNRKIYNGAGEGTGKGDAQHMR